MQTLDRTMSNMVAFVQLAAGAIRRTTLDKLRDLRHSVLDYGADPTGAKDSTLAFDAARTATGGAYHVPNGMYRVSDYVLADVFTAGPQVSLHFPGNDWDVSNATAGRLRWTSAAGAISLSDSRYGTAVFTVGAGTLGFFGSAGSSRPTVSGKTTELAVLAIAEALASLGLINNSITYEPPPQEPPAT